MPPYNDPAEIARDLKSTTLYGLVPPRTSIAPATSVHISPPDALGRSTVSVKCTDGKIAADLPEIVNRAAQTANSTNTNVHIDLHGCEVGVKQGYPPPQYRVSAQPTYPYPVLLPSPRTESKPRCAKRRKKWLLPGILLALGLDAILFIKTGWSVILVAIILVVIVFEKLFALLSQLF